MPQMTPNVKWPELRSFNTLTCLFDPDSCGGREQKILLLWGKYHDDFISSESWVLELSPGGYEFKWTKVRRCEYFNNDYMNCPL